MNVDEILGRIGSDTPPTREELAEVRSILRESLEASAEARAAGEPVELEALRALRDGIAAVDAEIASRTESEAAEAAEIAEILDGVTIEDTEPETAPEPVEEAEEPVAVAASMNGLVRRRPVISEEEPAQPRAVVAAVGPAVSESSPMTMDDLAGVFARHGSKTTSKTSLVSLTAQHPRELVGSPSQNSRIIDQYLSPIVAAGGVCEPVEALYDVPFCGERGRPIRDGLPGFGASRGGVRFGPSISVGDFTSAITVWTAETDADPGSDVKACPRIDCDDEIEVLVDAIVACVTVGNFQARFNPERWRSILDVLMIEHDRVAEQTLAAQIASQSTDVTVSDEDGTLRSTLIGLDKAAAGIRSRERMPNVALRWIAPAWLRDALRSSATRQQPGDQITSVSDTLLGEWMAARNIRPIWSPDLQVFSAQNAGALADYPSTANTYLFPEGTFIHLDGGTLDLGTDITDSTLNATNDRQAFVETFETVAYRGCESVELIIPVDESCVCDGLS